MLVQNLIYLISLALTFKMIQFILMKKFQRLFRQAFHYQSNNLLFPQRDYLLQPTSSFVRDYRQLAAVGDQIMIINVHCYQQFHNYYHNRRMHHHRCCTGCLSRALLYYHFLILAIHHLPDYRLPDDHFSIVIKVLIVSFLLSSILKRCSVEKDRRYFFMYCRFYLLYY